MGSDKKKPNSTEKGSRNGRGKRSEQTENVDFAGSKANRRGAPPTVDLTPDNMDTSTDNEMEWRLGAGAVPKRKRHNTRGEHIPLQSIDDKLDAILSQLSSLPAIEKKVGQLDRKLSRNLLDVKEIRADIKEFELKLKTLEYKTLDQEARGRRNNLLFWGVEEAQRDVIEDCDRQVKLFVKERVHVDCDLVIQRAHRLGVPRPGKIRPIIACLRDYNDVERIMKSVGCLKGSKYGVSRDFPNEINAARKQLYPKMKQYKADPGNKVVMQYPAKLLVNGTVVEDAFPNWFHFLNRRYEQTPDGSPRSPSQQTSIPIRNTPTGTDARQESSETETEGESEH